jgi:hypothetical protein
MTITWLSLLFSQSEEVLVPVMQQLTTGKREKLLSVAECITITEISLLLQHNKRVRTQTSTLKSKNKLIAPAPETSLSA